MDRFFVSPEDWSGDRLVLSGDEAHHCLRVMRKEVGDRVELFDGAGRRAVGAPCETRWYRARQGAGAGLTRPGRGGNARSARKNATIMGTLILANSEG